MLSFDWILNLDNTAVVIKPIPKDLALGKAEGAVIKCFKSLPAHVSWINVKAIWRPQLSLVQAVMCATAKLGINTKKKGESSQDFNFEFSELIQALTKSEPKEIKDLFKIYT